MIFFKKWRENKQQQQAHYLRLEELIKTTNLKLAQIEARLILNAPKKPIRKVVK